MISITIQDRARPAEVVSIRRRDFDDAFRMAAVVSQEFEAAGAVDLAVDLTIDRDVERFAGTRGPQPAFVDPATLEMETDDKFVQRDPSEPGAPGNDEGRYEQE